MRWVLRGLVVLVVGSFPLAATGIPFDDLRTTDDIGPNKIPHTGTSHILVIPTRVGTKSFPESQLSAMATFFDSRGGPGTFRHYWQVVSNGKYDPIPTLVKPVLFPTSCPLPGKDLASCHLTPSVDGVLSILDGTVSAGIKKILERVRDEQGIDLKQFDVNSGAGQKPDSYFDGVIIDSDIYQGIALPLAALKGEVAVPASSPTDTAQIKLGIFSLVPPDNHEFFHGFGLIDLYGGPPVNDLLGENTDATPSAFTRQQLGWTEVIKVTGPATYVLTPTLEGGSVLRIGDWGTRYLLLENRGGKYHAELGSDGVPGIYIYSIDESTLPTVDLGFLDPASSGVLYLPNAKPPYLCVNMPLNCSIGFAGTTTCALRSAGEERRLTHAAGNDAELLVHIDAVDGDGKITVSIRSSPRPPDSSETTSDAGSLPDRRAHSELYEGPPPTQAGCGCQTASPAPKTAALLLLIVPLLLGLAILRARSDLPPSARRNRLRDST